jgi:HAD superfamily hydrolase (TIGR01509 family)
VLFDLDGTLADSDPLIAAAVVESCAHYGYRVTAEEVTPHIGPPMVVMLQQMLPIGPEWAETITGDYRERYLDRFMPRTPPLPGARALLDGLRARGVPMAIVTNKNEDGGRALVRILGWERLFEVVVGVDTTGRGKPAPDPVLHALGALGAAPGAAAIVGDSPADMGAGRAAGLRAVIGLAGRKPADALREAGATHVVADLDAVAALLAGARGS